MPNKSRWFACPGTSRGPAALKAPPSAMNPAHLCLAGGLLYPARRPDPGRRLLAIFCCLLGVLLQPALASTRPNFVVILVDDGGFMDFGGYGGEAKTPNIDQLADEGVRFSNYHTSPLCAPSRAMLLTGLDNHRTGIGTIPEALAPEQAGSPVYASRLLPGVETIADRLRAAGYQTFMTGKWHLGSGPGDLPVDHGFDRSFILDASGADNWEQKSYIPFYHEAPWFEDGSPANLPTDFYSSRFLVDRMIHYLESRKPDRPFFSYLAFQAVHIPVQAPKTYTDRYAGVYSAGWEILRERRFARAKQLGLVQQDAVLPPAHPMMRPWGSLSPEEQTHYERSMMVNAGMLESMDHHLGRLIDWLREQGELAQTVFVITSDNGPEYNDPATDPSFRWWMRLNGYHTDLERMGERGSMGAIGPEWASAAAIPGSLFKMYASEGGTRVPMIIRGPGISASARFNTALNFVTDLAPTIAHLAGIDDTGDMDGRSLVPLLTGRQVQVYGREDAVGMEVSGNSALFKYPYKLTRNTLPHGDDKWRLHNLALDPAELHDLSVSHAGIRDELLADYTAYSSSMNVIELPASFDIHRQIMRNVRDAYLSRYRYLPWLLGLGGLALLTLGTAAWLRFKRSKARQNP